MMQEITCVDLISFVYELRSLLNKNDKIARFKIKNDRDVQYVLGEINGILKVYVTVQHSQQSSNVNQSVHAQFLHEPNHQSFVQLIAFQFSSTSGSNPLFEPDMWIGTAHEQHKRNKSIFFW